MIFATKHHLTGHVNGVHLGMKPHACHLCEMRFTPKGSLTRHVGAVHLGIQNHACNRCDMRFAELWRRLQLFTHLDANPDDENSEMALLLRDLVIGVY